MENWTISFTFLKSYFDPLIPFFFLTMFSLSKSDKNVSGTIWSGFFRLQKKKSELVYWNGESIVQTWKSKKLWLKWLGRIVNFHSRSRTTYFDYCAILLWHQTIETMRTIGLRKLIGFKLNSEYKLNLKSLGEWNPTKIKDFLQKD